MNGGSQRKGVGESVVSVTAVALDGGLLNFDNQACSFGYRWSVFQNNGAVIAIVKLQFKRAHERSKIRREMLKILHERSRKFPRKLPNCGSVFKSNPTMYSEFGPPGAIIERLGLKGYKIGDAVVSTQHANFFSTWVRLKLTTCCD